jgi:hypothetical protein
MSYGASAFRLEALTTIQVCDIGCDERVRNTGHFGKSEVVQGEVPDAIANQYRPQVIVGKA